MSVTDQRQEPREISPVQFFSRGHDLTYARGEGYNAPSTPLADVPEPTAADLEEAARLEAELLAAGGAAPKDAAAVGADPVEDLPQTPPPSPDDPEDKAGKAVRTPAKN